MKKFLALYFMLCFALQAISQEEKILIEISTELGNILLELYPEAAPITTLNFMEYVDSGHFTAASFYRTVTMDNQPDNGIKIEVIQGGLSGSGRSPGIKSITHETTEVTDLKHLHGTISMARSKPGTASSEFFICINDHPSLDYGGMRNPDGQGFAAFGKVIKGMDVVKTIQNSNYREQKLEPEINILSIKRIDAKSKN